MASLANNTRRRPNAQYNIPSPSIQISSVPVKNRVMAIEESKSPLTTGINDITNKISGLKNNVSGLKNIIGDIRAMEDIKDMKKSISPTPSIAPTPPTSSFVRSRARAINKQVANIINSKPVGGKSKKNKTRKNKTRKSRRNYLNNKRH